MRQHSTALLTILLTILLLGGCTLSPSTIRQGDRAMANGSDQTLTCQREDHCAEDSPLIDAAEQAMAASTPQTPSHIVTLLGASEPALVSRINLIRAARTSIDVQTYIWDQDDAGNLVLDELVQAARRGVKVRILADQLFSFSDPAWLGRLAFAHKNLQIRLYNPTFNEAQTSPLEFAAGIACCFYRFNQRMHNKILLVDGLIGITGGRNYQNRYFDWDDDFDYVDRDVMVGGPAAQAMSASFELFWHHKRAVPLSHLRDISPLLRRHAPQPWTTPVYARPERVARVQQEANDPVWLQDNLIAPSFIASRVEFFSDLPAKTEQPKERDAREFTANVMHLVGSATHEVILQTPYLVLSDRAEKIFARLQQQATPPRIVVSTNSLASTDAFAVYALSYKHRKKYLKDFAFEIYELKPHAPGPAEDNAEASRDDGPEPGSVPVEPVPPRRDGNVRPVGSGGGHRAIGTENRSSLTVRRNGERNRPPPLISVGRRFALHAKSIVIDDRFGMVGSHNFDPRSDHYNTEAGVIVYDAAFARALRDEIMRDTEPDNAWVIGPRQRSTPVLSDVSAAVEDISTSLPLFDFWPYRYATSYEMKPGCTPMRPSDPAFLSCYTPVGDFPDVALSSKLVYTRLITAFGAGAEGVL